MACSQNHPNVSKRIKWEIYMKYRPLPSRSQVLSKQQLSFASSLIQSPSLHPLHLHLHCFAPSVFPSHPHNLCESFSFLKCQLNLHLFYEAKLKQKQPRENAFISVTQSSKLPVRCTLRSVMHELPCCYMGSETQNYPVFPITLKVNKCRLSYWGPALSIVRQMSILHASYRQLSLWLVFTIRFPNWNLVLLS